MIDWFRWCKYGANRAGVLAGMFQGLAEMLQMGKKITAHVALGKMILV